ncbi:MAG TPA: hypothetical protein VKE40_00060 [Gemmataceae bacterium]|nr:hypothetical protein [Gemmataceae bacterium]
MPFPLRAALGAAPALIVVAGSAWVAHIADRTSDRPPGSDTYEETVLWPSPDDEARMHRLAVKQEAVSDLMDGLLTLEEVVERFEDVTESSAESVNNMRRTVEGGTDRDRILNQVVLFARVYASNNPRRYQEARRRIEQEARSLASSHGTVH